MPLLCTCTLASWYVQQLKSNVDDSGPKDQPVGICGQMRSTPSQVKPAKTDKQLHMYILLYWTSSQPENVSLFNM